STGTTIYCSENRPALLDTFATFTYLGHKTSADLLLLSIATFFRRRLRRLLFLLFRYCRFLCGAVACFLSIIFGHELTLFVLPVKPVVLVVDLRICVDPHESFRLCICDFLRGRCGGRLGRSLAGFLCGLAGFLFRCRRLSETAVSDEKCRR